LVIERSAAAVTVFVSVAESLPGTVSLVLEETVAVFETEPEASADTVYETVIDFEPPAAIEPRLHVKLGAPEHVPFAFVIVPWV
jgi:hypothetical protein